MRELTQEELSERDRRRRGFDKFLEERMPVLAEFAQKLGLADAPLIVAEAGRFLPQIDAFMRNQVIEPDDRVWILTRLGYFLGELLVQCFSGCWFLNEIPDSRYFLRYVVGRFARASVPNVMVDPFYLANAYLSEPPGRSLTDVVDHVVAELMEVWRPN